MMDMTTHDIATLFAQLGLDNSPEDIKAFAASHKIPADVPLDRAPFWSSAQANFLTENLKQDADWSDVIDQLNVLLR